MKTYTLRVAAKDSDIFNALRRGDKKVETRAVSKRYAHMQAGDTLVFVCGNRRLQKKAKRVRTVRSVGALLRAYPLKKIHPGLKTAAQLRSMYDSFPGYAQKIKESGLIVVEL